MEFLKKFGNITLGAGHFTVAGTGNLNGTSDKENKIIVDASTMNMLAGTAYRGIGCITGNNSSRLLLDYKELHPEIYNEILRLLFEKGYGAELSHIKIEFGADVNSSSGTEPCTMRSSDEKADVMRGAGFIFAADAIKINPDITVDLLRWGEPKWVKDAFLKSNYEGYKARYKWYIDTIGAAYEKLGLRFTHISADANETDNADTEWLIYFSEHIKNEINAKYDYKSIKIVASDEVGTRTIAAEMVENERLRNSVDVIGLHYTTYGDENTLELSEKYGKEIWYSEGIAPCNVPKFAIKKDNNGLCGINSAVDVANRIINSYFNGRMVMYEFQPAVSAYYNGSCYSPKQIITANEPWSGHYIIDSGFYMAMHFTRFTQSGWRFIDSACYGDGEENHHISNTTKNYLTLMPEDKSEVTIIFTNDSSKSRGYRINFENCDFNDRLFNKIETTGPMINGKFDENWFRYVKVERLENNELFITVKPFSIVTVSTLNAAFVNGTDTIKQPVSNRNRLLLPYTDTFDYDEDFNQRRGGAPLYTTDQGGAFELVNDGNFGFLQQKITADNLPSNWRFRGTPNPITCLGDETWSNYQAEIKFKLFNCLEDNYAGLGVRYNSAVACDTTSNNGLSVRIYNNGKWEILFMDDVVSEGETDFFHINDWNKLRIIAVGNVYAAYLNDKEIGSYTEQGSMQTYGRVAIISGYYNNIFKDLTIEPVSGMRKYIDLIDALSPNVKYDGIVLLDNMASYKYNNRTCSKLQKNSGFSVSYYGYDFALCGSVTNAVITIAVDGEIIADNIRVGESEYRQAFFRSNNLEKGTHRIKVLICSGEVILDSINAFTNASEYSENIIETAKTNTPKLNKSNVKKAAVVAAAGVSAALIAKKFFGKKK